MYISKLNFQKQEWQSLEKEFLTKNDGFNIRYQEKVEHEEELNRIEQRSKDSMDSLKHSVKNSRERVIELLDERTRMEKEIFYLWQDKRRLS